MTIVDPQVTQPSLPRRAYEGEVVAHLVGDSAHRPLLRERRIKIGAAPACAESGDVLHDSLLLVVRFLHQEAVVLNTGRGGGLRRGDLCVRRCWCKGEKNEQISGSHLT